jgi:hypothetical protein
MPVQLFAAPLFFQASLGHVSLPNSPGWGMPGFPNLNDDQLSALVEFLMGGENEELQGSGPPSPAMKYRLTGYKKFLDPDGYPAVAPPWGDQFEHR